MKGCYIKSSMVNNLLNYFKERNIIPLIDYKIMRNEELNNNCFACGNEDDFKLYDTIIIPRVLTNDPENDYMLEYQKRYGFNHKEFASQNDMEFWEVSVLFSLLHEIGHIEYVAKMSEVKGFDYLVSEAYEELNYMEMIYNDDRLTEEQKNLEYRLQGTEQYADKKAIELLNTYKEDLINIVKGGVIVDKMHNLLFLDSQSTEELISI